MIGNLNFIQFLLIFIAVAVVFFFTAPFNPIIIIPGIIGVGILKLFKVKEENYQVFGIVGYVILCLYITYLMAVGEWPSGGGDGCQEIVNRDGSSREYCDS
jgi:hypothetical protein